MPKQTHPIGDSVFSRPPSVLFAWWVFTDFPRGTPKKWRRTCWEAATEGEAKDLINWLPYSELPPALVREETTYTPEP